MQEEPLFLAEAKEDGLIRSGFGWCYTDYTDEFLKELNQDIQDIYLYTKQGVVLCYGDSVIQV